MPFLLANFDFGDYSEFIEDAPVLIIIDKIFGWHRSVNVGQMLKRPFHDDKNTQIRRSRFS
jgi:hypothetical protein